MSEDFSILSHAGVEVYQIRRFDTTCHVHILDLAHARVKLVAGFMAVPDRAKQNGAQLAFNANGWGLHPLGTALSNEYLVIEGVVIQSRAIDSRPCMNITKAGEIEFLNKPDFATAWNVIGFDRYIARSGVYNTKITNSNPDPRTVYGKDAFGCLVVLVCDGRKAGEKGLTFRECWSVMKEFAVTDCGNADGGYSSCAYNQVFGSAPMNATYLVENRRTVMQVLFYANPLGEVPPTGETTMSKAVVRKEARFRSKPTMTTTDTGPSSVVGFEFDPAATQPDTNNPTITMVQVPLTAASAGAGKWLPLSIQTAAGLIVYTELVDDTNPPAPVEDSFTVTLVYDQTGATYTGKLTRKP